MLLLLAFAEARRVCSGRRILIFFAGLLLGAYPLLRFNLKNHGSTLGENAHVARADLESKIRLMALTLNGEAAHEAFIRPEIKAPDRAARPFAAVTLAIAHHSGLQIGTFVLQLGIVFLCAGAIWA